MQVHHHSKPPHPEQRYPLVFHLHPLCPTGVPRQVIRDAYSRTVRLKIYYKERSAHLTPD